MFARGKEKKKLQSRGFPPARVSSRLACPEYFGEASAGEDAIKTEAACVCVGGRGGGWN